MDLGRSLLPCHSTNVTQMKGKFSLKDKEIQPQSCVSRDPLWIVANNEDSSLFRCEFFQTFIGSTFQKDQKRHQGSLLFWSIQAKCQEGKGADVTVKNCRLKFILRIYYIKKLPVAGDIDSCLFLRFLLNIKTVEYNKPLPDGTKPLSQVANMEFLRL